MAVATGRLLFLTGAPVAADLSWSRHNCNAELCPRIRRYLGIFDDDDGSFLLTQTPHETSHPFAKWRHIPFHEDESLDHAPEAPRFLSFREAGHRHPSQEHIDFLEHSLALLQDLDSSQICVAPDETAYNETTFVSALSFDSDTSLQSSYGSSFSTNDTGEPSQQIVSFSGHITDLQRIPAARHLETIHPQTMTVNVLASVISVQPARTVRLRKRSGQMDIIEVLVGDETRAGFPISFWLPPADSQHAPRSRLSANNDALRHTLGEVRSGDALLITHIALGQFNGNVYGQSLSRPITRNNTSLVRLSDHVTGLSAPAMAKTKRVKEWAAHFVGRPEKRPASPAGLETAASGKRRSILPPDTQPDCL